MSFTRIRSDLLSTKKTKDIYLLTKIDFYKSIFFKASYT